jgi:phytoene synthase
VEETLTRSFEHCQQLTRRQAGNFYYSFLTLPRAKREAMCVVYAWMRLLDDRADDAPSTEEAQRALESWRTETHQAIDRNSPPAETSPSLWPAFADVVHRYQIPVKFFDEIVEGALMDQTIMRYETPDDLYRYCYRVASVVGLVSLRVLGFTDPRAEIHGEALGIAFQLTNILRDVREDAGRGRIYLPLEELQRNGVKESDILENRWSDGLHQALKEFAVRTQIYYQKAEPIFDCVTPEARSTLRIMTEIYHGIFVELRRLDFRVFEHRARVPTWKKLWIVAKWQVFGNRF